ncbi:8835_t:CDS:2 [Ambispora leptoticha]|uniref:8835_t:CDS:1 n=1 Tax=Ambispora leptoticha TaxID=144679 RepID=A0A9N9FMG7_9GLOM|nr:8835_t:CDS:2 [Ambispora leptoticha]
MCSVNSLVIVAGFLIYFKPKSLNFNAGHNSVVIINAFTAKIQVQ